MFYHYKPKAWLPNMHPAKNDLLCLYSGSIWVKWGGLSNGLKKQSMTKLEDSHFSDTDYEVC